MSVPAEWATVAKSMKSLLVSVPSGQVVLSADDNSPASLAAFKALTAKMYGESDRPVSKTVLRCTPRGWTPIP